MIRYTTDDVKLFNTFYINCDSTINIVIFQLNRGDGSVEEKSKIKPIKWSFMKKEKCPVKGVMDGAPITQEGICQVYQLIDFLSKEESMYIISIHYFVNYCAIF